MKSVPCCSMGVVSVASHSQNVAAHNLFLIVKNLQPTESTEL